MAQLQKLSQNGRCKGWTGRKTIYSRFSMKLTADNSLDLGQQSLTLTKPLFLWDGHPVLTADVPSSSAGTVSDAVGSCHTNKGNQHEQQ